jgi:hypothetical protein
MCVCMGVVGYIFDGIFGGTKLYYLCRSTKKFKSDINKER